MSTTEITVVRPQGRLDAAGSPALDRELRQHLALGRRHLLVDLSDTSYISSNGLRALLAALKAARQGGGTLKLCCLSARLEEIFEMAGFDQVFDIYETRAAAEGAFEGQE
jgi:anti-sigma B factor antagonist